MTQNYKKDFSGQNIAVGIDIHLRTWSVSVLTESGCMKTHSQEASAEKLFEHLKKQYPNGLYHAVYETGFSGFSTYYELTRLGIECTLVHAADVPTTQKEKMSKSDPVDSKKLARALMHGELTSVYVHRKDNLDYRSLVRFRTVIVKTVCGIKTRIKHLLYNNGVKYPAEFFRPGRHWSRNFINWLQNDVKLLSDTRVTLDLMVGELIHLRDRLREINLQLRILARSDKFAADYDNLISVPGIGPITAMTLLTEIDDIGRFDNQRQFASFLGLIPTMRASGEKESSGEMTFRGNKQIGPKIVEASWMAIRNDLYLSSRFAQHRARGLKPQEAVIRIARKLSNIIFFILKNHKRYECR